MKKICLCLISMLIIFCDYQSIAQSTGINYSFSQPAGGMAYNNSSAGSVTLIAGGADDSFATFNIPATFPGFYFGGTWFPQGSVVTVSSNGWLSLSPQSNALAVNSLATTPLIIAPLWDDLRVHSDGEVSYKIIGGATARALVIEWRGMLWDKNATDTALSFQAVIYDHFQAVLSMRSMIEFRYKRNGIGSTNVNNPSASIGLSGFCAGDIFAFTDASGLPDKTVPENSSIALKPQDVLRHVFTPVAHPNNECANAEVLSFDPALPLIPVIATTLHSTQSSVNLPACASPTSVSDIWFTFTKPAGITNFEIYTDSLDCRGGNYVTGLEIFSSCGGASIACDVGSSGPTGTNADSYLNLVNQSCNAQQYWVRAYSLDTLYRGYFRFNLRPPGSICENANDITGCGLPYTSITGLTTCGFGNEYDSTNSVPHTPYSFGDDYVFSFTPSSNICVDVLLSNTPSNSSPGLFLSKDCPFGAGTNIASAAGNGGTLIGFNNISLLAGNIYYFVVDNDTIGGSDCLSSFEFSVTSSSSAPAVNDICASAASIPVVTAASCTGPIDYSNNCASATAAGTVPLPGCGNFTDGVTADVWFTFSSSGTNLHRIIVDQGTSPWAEDLAMAVYSGTCGSLTLITCDDHSNAPMPAAVVIPPAAGTVYYVRVWSNNGTHPGNFRICVLEGCTAANDFCLTAIPLTPGQYASGDNSCATDLNEPGPASCWTVSLPAERNNVWYSFVATSDSMNINVHLLSLFDSQIALYESTGPCTGLNQIFCNDNSPLSCGIISGSQSEIHATGLTVGNTYYIRVEGSGSNTGTFEIMVQPDTISFPALFAQDCPLAIPLCDNSTITSSNTLYNGSGNLCDVQENTTCLAIGETNSVFYTFNVTGTGAGTPVEFTITPNGFSNCDFMLWCIDTVYNDGDQIPAVPNYCDNLSNTSMFPAVVCNYSYQGITGCSVDAGLCNMICYQNYAYNDTGMTPAVVVPNGMTATFLLLVNNNYPQGFTLDWMGTPINGNLQNMIWLGGNSTDWYDLSNWAGSPCAVIPDCINGIPAVISAGTFNPVLAANTTVSDLIISPGATLTINPGVTLNICSNFTNNGSLVSGASSTVRFIGSSNSAIGGTFNQGFNNFQNVEISKSANAEVQLMTDIYIKGNDSIYGGSFLTTIYNIEVGGNFYNYNGHFSFVTFSPSTITFTGRGLMHQQFRNDGAPLTLSNVTMNQITPGTLSLHSNVASDLILNYGALTLISGKIVTGNRMVNITTLNPASCTAGNSTSYVEGNLMRSIVAATADYEFPVGEATKGYQRLHLEYSVAPTAIYTLLAKFRQWTPMPSAGPSVIECLNSGWQLLPPFDQGYWTMDASTTTGLGTYNMTAYPLNVTNQSGLTFSIMKSISNSGLGPWLMEGTPFCPSTPSQVQRDNLTTFSDFAIVQSDLGNTIAFPENEKSFISVAPNPASGKATIHFNASLTESFVIHLRDLTGRIVLSETIVPSGKEFAEIELTGIVPGVYLLHAAFKDRSDVVRLVIKGE